MTRKQTNSQPSARSRKPGRQEAAPRDSAPSDFGKLGAAIRRTRAIGRPVSIALPRTPRPVPLPDPIVALLADALDAFALDAFALDAFALDAFARGHRVELAIQTPLGKPGKSRSATETTGATCHYLILDRDPNEEITTQEAAAALRVSRPTIIKAIEEGRLAARKVGKHRRVRIYDFNAYVQKEHAARVAHAMESTRFEQEWGLHDSTDPISLAEWKRISGRVGSPQFQSAKRATPQPKKRS
jgi:excisionase family DNA binding protein